MKDQSKTWNEKIVGSALPSSLKNLSFSTELLPQLKYPLTSISLTETDVSQIIKVALVSIKHGLGLANTAETGIMFSPKECCGYGVPDLHVKKMAEQTRYIIQHSRNEESLG